VISLGKCAHTDFGVNDPACTRASVVNDNACIFYFFAYHRHFGYDFHFLKLFENFIWACSVNVTTCTVHSSTVQKALRYITHLEKGQVVWVSKASESCTVFEKSAAEKMAMKKVAF
jgi:hypothetical protein